MALEVQEITGSNLSSMPLCGIRKWEHEGRQAKEHWLRDAFAHGLVARVLLDEGGMQCGYVESLPGEHAWRGVAADDYLFIHCLWNHYKRHRGMGYGTRLIQACVDDARQAGFAGVATLARGGPWLAGSDVFLKNGFELSARTAPDYELLVKKLDPAAPSPRFKGDWERRRQRYGTGLTIVRSEQCPHSIRFAGKIAAAAEASYGLAPEVVTLSTLRQAQSAPTPFSAFAVIHDGELLADHPISVRRFRSLMTERRLPSRRGPDRPQHESFARVPTTPG